MSSQADLLYAYVGQQGSWQLKVVKGKVQIYLRLLLNSPFLHLAVGLAAVINEASFIAHAIAVNDHATVQVQTVLTTVREVLFHHSTP